MAERLNLYMGLKHEATFRGRGTAKNYTNYIKNIYIYIWKMFIFQVGMHISC
jgi:hypothetical protein